VANGRAGIGRAQQRKKERRMYLRRKKWTKNYFQEM